MHSLQPLSCTTFIVIGTIIMAVAATPHPRPAPSTELASAWQVCNTIEDGNQECPFVCEGRCPCFDYSLDGSCPNGGHNCVSEISLFFNYYRFAY